MMMEVDDNGAGGGKGKGKKPQRKGVSAWAFVGVWMGMVCGCWGRGL
jgi:hypothetical protein